MSSNAYAQVALTYIRRPFASWMGWFITICIVVMCLPLIFMCCSSRANNRLDFFGPQVLMPFVFIFAYLATHIKDQFADPRARLTPDFRRVHILAAVAMATVAAVLLPWLFSSLLGLRPLGFIAFAAMLFGAVLWQVVTRSKLFGMVLVVGWVLITMPSAFNGPQGVLQQFVAGQFIYESLGILLLGVIVTAFAGVRLLHLTEDMPEYQKILWNADWSGRNLLNRQMWNRENQLFPWLWDWLAEHQMARLTRHAAGDAAPKWSRVCRWQAGLPTGLSLLFWPVGILLILMAMSWIMPIPNQPGTSNRPSATVMFIPFFLAIMPASAIIGQFMRRSGTLSFELMLPVDRKTYVRQIGLAFFASNAQLWFAICFGMVAWWIAVAWQPEQLPLLATTLILSAANQVFMFGAMAWAMILHSRLIGALAMMLLFPASQFLPIRFHMLPANSTGMSAQYGIILAASVVLVCLGLIFAYTGYRRWLNADFD